MVLKIMARWFGIYCTNVPARILNVETLEPKKKRLPRCYAKEFYNEDVNYIVSNDHDESNNGISKLYIKKPSIMSDTNIWITKDLLSNTLVRSTFQKMVKFNNQKAQFKWKYSFQVLHPPTLFLDSPDKVPRGNMKTWKLHLSALFATRYREVENS